MDPRPARVTAVICHQCRQAIPLSQMADMGLDAANLAEELQGRRLITLQLNQLRRRLEQHQKDHDCCRRGHDCRAVWAVKPAWYPW